MQPGQRHALSSNDTCVPSIMQSLRSRIRLVIQAGFVFGTVLGVLTTGVALTADTPKKPTASEKKDAGKKDAGKSKKSESLAADAKTEDANDAKKSDSADEKRPEKIVKTEAEWKKLLKPEQFRVARLKETEPPFQNKFWNNHRHGKYLCVCCGEELYRSEEKFDSGTGWPSFWAAANERAVATEVDNSHNSIRMEVLCDRCGAHLGHVFDDGPQPTGMRHCINSASLKFVATETKAPAKATSSKATK